MFSILRNYMNFTNYMKIEKVEKLEANLHDKIEYVIHKKFKTNFK